MNISARPKIPINTLSLFRPFVIDKIIAIPIDNTPIRLQGFNALNFSNHLNFEFNNKLKNPTDQCINSEFSPFLPFLPLNRPILEQKQKTPRMNRREAYQLKLIHRLIYVYIWIHTVYKSDEKIALQCVCLIHTHPTPLRFGLRVRNYVELMDYVWSVSTKSVSTFWIKMNNYD